MDNCGATLAMLAATERFMATDEWPTAIRRPRALSLWRPRLAAAAAGRWRAGLPAGLHRLRRNEPHQHFTARLMLGADNYICVNPQLDQTFSMDDCGAIPAMLAATERFMATHEWRLQSARINKLFGGRG